jgi:hypothetical protein
VVTSAVNTQNPITVRTTGSARMNRRPSPRSVIQLGICAGRSARRARRTARNDAADRANVAASIANVDGAPIDATSAPAIAGPTTYGTLSVASM